MELDDLDSVQHWADKLKEELQGSKLKIKLFVCNAGVMHVPFKLTKDKIETHMQVNHLSHYLLIRNVRVTVQQLYGKTFYYAHKESLKTC